MTGGWQQTQRLVRGGNIAELQQSIDRNLQGDRSLNGLMNAVWSLEQAQGATHVANPYRSQALQLARQQIQQGTKEPLPWVATAKFALEDRDDATFRQVTRELVQRFPTNPQGHYFEGVRAIQDQDWKAAEGALKKARELGMSDESLAELLKMAIDNQKWIWQYAQIAFGVIIAWLCGLVALWAVGWVLSRLTLRAIARGHIEANSLPEQLVRRLYRVIVNLAGVYYFLSLPVVLLTAIALPLALGYAMLMVPMLNLWLLGVVLLGGIGGVLTAISGVRTAFVKVVDEPVGRSLSKQEAPQFWELVREVAAKMETRPVDDIWLTPHTDLAVTERGSWIQKLRDRGQRVLILGAGILPGFKTDALRCVLAHEYAHFQHRDTAGGDVALRVSLAMNRFAEAIMARGKIRWWDVTVHFLRWYHYLFRRLTLGASRLQEVLADRAAVRQCGASALEEGLRHVIRRNVEFDYLLNDAVRQSVRAQPVPLGFYSPSREMTLEDRHELETVIAEVIGRQTTDEDSHPAPQERFELAKRLGVDRAVSDSTVQDLLHSTAERLNLDMANLLNDLVKARAEEIKTIDGILLQVLDDNLRQRPDPALLEERAKIHFRLGHFSEAIADLTQILKDYPDAAGPLHSRSIVHEANGNPAAAAADLKALREMGYRLPFEARFEILYRLGKCLSELKQHKEAAEAFDEALRLHADSLLATVGRLRVAQELNELNEPKISKLRERALATWPEQAEMFDVVQTRAAALSAAEAVPVDAEAEPVPKTERDELDVLSTGGDDDASLTDILSGDLKVDLKRGADERTKVTAPKVAKQRSVPSSTRVAAPDPETSKWQTSVVNIGCLAAVGLSFIGFLAGGRYLYVLATKQIEKPPVIATNAPNSTIAPASVAPPRPDAEMPIENPAPQVNETVASNGLPAAPSVGVDAPEMPLKGLPVAAATKTAPVEPADTEPVKPPSPTLVYEQYGARLGPQLGADFFERHADTKLLRLSAAFHQLMQKTGSFSPLPAQGSSGLSWRVHLLPYLNQQRLYNQFALNEPWDSPHNRALIPKMPNEYQLLQDTGLTRVRVFTGPGMPFEAGHLVRPEDFIDGVDATALVFVVGPDQAVPWTMPDEEAFDIGDPLKTLALQKSDPFAVITAGMRVIIATNEGEPQKIAALATARGGELLMADPAFDRRGLPFQLVPDSERLRATVHSQDLSVEQEHQLARDKLKIIGEALRKQEMKMQRVTPYGPSDLQFRNLSWRVHLLPLLGQEELYKEFHLEEAWTSPHNLGLIERMPDVFGLQSGAGRTRFVVPVGDELLFSAKYVSSFSGITDDPASTAAVYYLGSQRATIWTQPEWFILTREQPRATLGVAADDPLTLLFANGDVTTLPPQTHHAKLFALATARGGEVIDLPAWFGKPEVAKKAPPVTFSAATPIKNVVKLPSIPVPAAPKITETELGAGPPKVDPALKNLRMVGLAFHRYHDTYNQFSVSNKPEWFDKEGRPKLSWRVHLLPFLDQTPLYQRFKLNEAWDSENNLPLQAQMPAIFRTEGTDDKSTRLCVLVGDKTLFRHGQPARMRDATDGILHTILVAEVGTDKAVPWTKPDDLPFDVAHPMESLGKLDKQFRAVMADGSLLSIPSNLPAEVFAALATASGAEIVDADTVRRYAAHLSGKPTVNPLVGKFVEQNKVKHILLAMHNFHDTYNYFPPVRNRKQVDVDGRPLLSWRVHLLPYLDQGPLAQQFRYDEPWDSPHNLQLLPLMPDIYRDSQAAADSITTRLMTFSGANTPFPPLAANIEKGISVRHITDGSSNTILVMQAGPDRTVPWTKPDDLEFDIAAPLQCLGTIPVDTGLLVGLFDGAVRTLTPIVTPDQFKALVTPSGNEVIAGDILK